MEHNTTTDFDYDAMNRQTRSAETSEVKGARWIFDWRTGATPSYEKSITVLKYGYDLAGNRVREQTFDGIAIAGSPDGTVKKPYDYVYDDLHRMAGYTGFGASDKMDGILYDGAGRQVAARTLVGETGGSYEYRYSQYDATGK
ncbi:hypothetical protein E4195_28430, partial [Pseudomonas putida]|uniref:hypothetical protein n=1 Tax=Pseudomonas putida TaxID=303 RepID=UPI001075231F